MIEIIESEVREFDTTKWAEMVTGPECDRFLRPAGEHYRLFIYLAHQISNGIFYDIGTCSGASALALGSNPSNHVVSWDITEDYRKAKEYAWPCVDGMDNLEFRTKDIFEEPTWIYDVADIIFLDITPHDGVQERKFMEVLDASNFEGILILDDIRGGGRVPKRYPKMVEWWESIDRPKYELSYAHTSGTGIISYGEELKIS